MLLLFISRMAEYVFGCCTWRGSHQVIAKFGNRAQQDRWLKPLMEVSEPKHHGQRRPLLVCMC